MVDIRKSGSATGSIFRHGLRKDENVPEGLQKDRRCGGPTSDHSQSQCWSFIYVFILSCRYFEDDPEDKNF